jgi:hypothetical protein
MKWLFLFLLCNPALHRDIDISTSDYFNPRYSREEEKWMERIKTAIDMQKSL